MAGCTVIYFKVGDRGHTRDGRDYEVVTIGVRHLSAVIGNKFKTSFALDGIWRKGQSSSCDLCRPMQNANDEVLKPASFDAALHAHVAACNRFEAAQRELEDARKAVEVARDAVREAV